MGQLPNECFILYRTWYSHICFHLKLPLSPPEWPCKPSSCSNSLRYSLWDDLIENLPFASRCQTKKSASSSCKCIHNITSTSYWRKKSWTILPCHLFWFELFCRLPRRNGELSSWEVCLFGILPSYNKPTLKQILPCIDSANWFIRGFVPRSLNLSYGEYVIMVTLMVVTMHPNGLGRPSSFQALPF